MYRYEAEIILKRVKNVTIVRKALFIYIIFLHLILKEEQVKMSRLKFVGGII
jgi:hypothetical protein